MALNTMYFERIEDGVVRMGQEMDICVFPC